MKTKFLGIWTKDYDKFLKAISNEKISYEELGDWMDKKGKYAFKTGQEEYFKSIASKFVLANLLDKIELADLQIKAGFAALQKQLQEDFPNLSVTINDYYCPFSFMIDLPFYRPFVAIRAVITQEVLQEMAQQKVTFNAMQHTLKQFETIEAFFEVIPNNFNALLKLKDIKDINDKDVENCCFISKHEAFQAAIQVMVAQLKKVGITNAYSTIEYICGLSNIILTALKLGRESMLEYMAEQKLKSELAGNVSQTVPRGPASPALIKQPAITAVAKETGELSLVRSNP